MRTFLEREDILAGPHTSAWLRVDLVRRLRLDWVLVRLTLTLRLRLSSLG